jgi:epoxyqueuosine reductase QueG
MIESKNPLTDFIVSTIHQEVKSASTTTRFREPIIGFATADDPRFSELRHVVDPNHHSPENILPGARSVISFFLPFDSQVVEANSKNTQEVAPEWAIAYLETNALISHIADHLIEQLSSRDVRADAEPPTHNYDPLTFFSPWSHKSVAVIAGIGSFGLHQMVITDAGCAGRFGSVVINAPMPVIPIEESERCLYYHDGSCLECVVNCPVGALDENGEFDKQACGAHLDQVAQNINHLGLADVCGKCAVGPCALKSSVE